MKEELERSVMVTQMFGMPRFCSSYRTVTASKCSHCALDLDRRVYPDSTLDQQPVRPFGQPIEILLSPRQAPGKGRLVRPDDHLPRPRLLLPRHRLHPQATGPRQGRRRGMVVGRRDVQDLDRTGEVEEQITGKGFGQGGRTSGSGGEHNQGSGQESSRERQGERDGQDIDSDRDEGVDKYGCRWDTAYRTLSRKQCHHGSRIGVVQCHGYP
jgi:hypothetical protein